MLKPLVKILFWAVPLKGSLRFAARCSLGPAPAFGGLGLGLTAHRFTSLLRPPRQGLGIEEAAKGGPQSGCNLA